MKVELDQLLDSRPAVDEGGSMGLSAREYVARTATERINQALQHAAEFLQDLTDLRNADDNTRQDYAGRFTFELLQNGADAHEKAVRLGLSGYSRGQGKVAFVLTETCLLVANTGATFSHVKAEGEPLSSLESISRLGESTKQGAQYIGEIDPDRRILKLLGAPRLVNLRHDSGTAGEKQRGKCILKLA